MAEDGDRAKGDRRAACLRHGNADVPLVADIAEFHDAVRLDDGRRGAMLVDGSNIGEAGAGLVRLLKLVNGGMGKPPRGRIGIARKRQRQWMVRPCVR